MDNKIKITTFEDGVVIKIYGELDSYKTLAYKTKIIQAVETYSPHLMLFDLKDLSFLDSAGIGLILGRYNEIKRIGGVVGLVGLNPYAAKIVRISGLGSIIKTYKSVAQFKKEAEVLL